MAGKKSVYVIAIVCLVLMITGKVLAEPITIVADGKAKANIVVPVKPRADEIFAAEQLQRYIQTMSGAKLVITDKKPQDRPYISIGDTGLVDVSSMMTKEEAEAGSFLMRTTGNGLVIQGGLPNGTLFGVYALLEELDCRFYAPGVDGERRAKAAVEVAQ